jgi:hypothetical protein
VAPLSAIDYGEMVLRTYFLSQLLEEKKEKEMLVRLSLGLSVI